MTYNDLEEYQQENFIKLRDYLKEEFGDKQESDSFNMSHHTKNGYHLITLLCGSAFKDTKLLGAKPSDVVGDL